MSNQIFKEGQFVKIVNRKYGHQFDIGENVKIIYCSGYDYLCSGKNYNWYVKDDEIELLKQENE